MPGIVLQRQWMLEVGELLIGETGCFAERPGSALPEDGGVLIGESALERHENVATTVNVISNLLEQSIVCNVQRRNDQKFVGREVGIPGEDKVCADVRLVEGAVDLREDGVIFTGGFAGSPSQFLLPFERHEADCVGRIDAVENRDLILNLKINDLRADLLQFVRDA